MKQKTLKEIREYIRITAGNDKLGNSISNISFPPLLTCSKDACRNCGSDCYALKFYNMREVVKNAWDMNIKCYKKNPLQFWGLIQSYIDKKKPEWFRFFVSGDFPNRMMVSDLINFASNNPDVKFLAFTKRYTWLPDPKFIPGNLTIIVSMWPGMPLPDILTPKKDKADKRLKYWNYPKAFMRDQDNLDCRIPTDAIECPGNCESCGMCWNLNTIGRDVVFNKH